MFKTDINHWLQQFDHPFFHWFFEGISAIGTVTVLVLVVYAIIMGAHFKKGFGIVNIFFYVIMVTIFCKHLIDYPRPMAVDASLNSFDRPVGHNLTNIQPKGFFELFSDNLLVKIRNNKAAREGFPSGHTSLITALTLGAALVFRRRWIWCLGAGLVPLMMLSRMYLARHYLGDVLGGLTIGIIVSLIVYKGWKAANNVPENSWAHRLFFLSALSLLILSPWLQAFPTGTFIGLNLGYVVLASTWGLPKLSSHWQQRLFSILVFAASAFIATYVSRRLGLAQYSLVSVLVFTGFALASFLSAAFVCIKLGWWSKPTTNTL
ncbi:phosphatase PAP2 family protein [uncultured Microscilla sp.]|uniref:phosphatase PAP2 family protein n=1 Tax=uncultured Microscilla sp. TaxID=432653 RepID=UPI0026376462|nr:phosphatase PAP2 family protein [uncultured Microscilla sp.]